MTYLTISDAARRLSLSKTLVADHSRRKGAPFVRFPGVRRVMVDFNAYVNWLREGGAEKS